MGKERSGKKANWVPERAPDHVNSAQIKIPLATCSLESMQSFKRSPIFLSLGILVVANVFLQSCVQVSTLDVHEQSQINYVGSWGCVDDFSLLRRSNNRVNIQNFGESSFLRTGDRN
jgi:hypothetical protein